MAGEEEGPDKRRRNLHVVSLALLAALWSGTIVGDMNVLGVQVRAPVKGPLAYYLWPFWLYFLWRFWQVFAVGHVSNKYMSAVERFISLYVQEEREQANEEYRAKQLIQPGERVIDADVGPRYQRSRFGWQSLTGVAWIPLAQSPTGKPGPRHILPAPGHDRQLDPGRVRRLRLRALYWITIRESPVLDWLLPFVVALLPVLLAVAIALGWWQPPPRLPEIAV